MVATYSADQLPLLKILFHAAKYPHAAINGVLLGEVGSSSSVRVTDVIPLFHNSIELAGPTEIALSQVEAYTKQPGRPQVVGYYHSDARFQASDMSPLTRRLADRIADRNSEAFVILLDNKKLASFLQEGSDEAGQSGGHPFELFCQDGKAWKREAPSKIAIASSKAVRDKFLLAVKQQSHRQLHDFDDHMDDLSQDFLNPGLAAAFGK